MEGLISLYFSIYSFNIAWLITTNLYTVIVCFFEVYAVFVFLMLKELALFFKFDWINRFNLCVDIIVYDEPNWEYRFSLVYYFLSLQYVQRFHLLTQLQSLVPRIESLSIIYKSINWSEREVWDIYGIIFIGHLDLRRLLTDYSFKGFPLRRDYPLTGYYEVVYSYIEQSIIYIIVTLTQDFRKYYFANPWLKNKMVGMHELTEEFINSVL